jgi:hypothetical protein
MAHAGLPHYLDPRISFLEVQEPSDHIVIPEASGDDEGATIGLGWDLAVEVINYTTDDKAETFAGAPQHPCVLRASHGSRQVRLFYDGVLRCFDATALGHGRDRGERRAGHGMTPCHVTSGARERGANSCRRNARRA